jgi:hypothetical protein
MRKQGKTEERDRETETDGDRDRMKKQGKTEESIFPHMIAKGVKVGVSLSLLPDCNCLTVATERRKATACCICSPNSPSVCDGASSRRAPVNGGRQMVIKSRSRNQLPR